MRIFGFATRTGYVFILKRRHDRHDTPAIALQPKRLSSFQRNSGDERVEIELFRLLGQSVSPSSSSKPRKTVSFADSTRLLGTKLTDAIMCAYRRSPCSPQICQHGIFIIPDWFFSIRTMQLCPAQDSCSRVPHSKVLESASLSGHRRVRRKKGWPEPPLKILLFVMPLFDALLSSVSAVSSPSIPRPRD